MSCLVSIVIPAWNEADRITQTLQAVTCGATYSPLITSAEVIVVDDGSTDETADIANQWGADEVIRFTHNRGKGAALEAGWQAARAQIVLFLDADLGESALHFPRLIEPVMMDQADMTIAKLPPARVRGGFGIVKKLARYGIATCSGFQASAPLSGQRALTRKLLEQLPDLGRGFGIEVGLTIDAVRLGFRVQEVEVAFRHRETARDWPGFVHRGKQFVAVGRTLIAKWEWEKT